MKVYICGSCGGGNGLYSSELALHKRHVGSPKMTIGWYSLLMWPKYVLYWAAKGLLFHMNYFLIICVD